MARKRRLVFGEDSDETWDPREQSDGKRAYDREAKRRQKLRSDNAPRPMFFDDTPPPGRLRSGLIERRPPRKGEP